MSPKLIATTSIWVDQSAKYNGLGLVQAIALQSPFE